MHRRRKGLFILTRGIEWNFLASVGNAHPQHEEVLGHVHANSIKQGSTGPVRQHLPPSSSKMRPFLMRLCP